MLFRSGAVSAGTPHHGKICLGPHPAISGVWDALDASRAAIGWSYILASASAKLDAVIRKLAGKRDRVLVEIYRVREAEMTSLSEVVVCTPR